VAYLLDVNALVALFWPAHIHHGVARTWFARRAADGWATTPPTQAGFVRIVSNPAFSRDAVSPAEASRLLAANLKHKQHRFKSADLSVPQALAQFGARIVGHRQVADAYLLALALRHRCRLATFDSGVLALLVDEDSGRKAVELLGTAGQG